jgi:hypothetical protein
MSMQRRSKYLEKYRLRVQLGKCGGLAGLTAAVAKNAQIGVQSATIG